MGAGKDEAVTRSCCNVIALDQRGCLLESTMGGAIFEIVRS